MRKLFRNMSIKAKIRLLIFIFVVGIIELLIFSGILLFGYDQVMISNKGLNEMSESFNNMSTHVRDFIIYENDEYIEKFDNEFVDLTNGFEYYLSFMNEQEINDFPELMELEKHAAMYYNEFHEFLETQDAGTPEEIAEAQEEILNTQHNISDKIIGILDKMNMFIENTISNLKSAALIFTGSFFAVVLFFIIMVMHSINKPIDQIMKIMPKLARKSGEKVDLSTTLEVNSKDEFGKISGYINDMMDQLNSDFSLVFRVLNKLSEAQEFLDHTAQDQAGEADNISESIGIISQNVEQQTSGVEQVSSTLEEMSRNIDHIAKNIEKQSSAVEESASTIEEMGRNIESITKVSVQTKSIANQLNQKAIEGGEAVNESIVSIQEVAEYSNQILKLLKLITDIAKQTNLLAMNASIEAAHAGEAGKGFAIVADEIRRLSETTNKNAKEIHDVVQTIVEKIDESVDRSKNAGEGLEQIVNYAKESDRTITQLNMMMEEQNTSVKEILRAIESLVGITEEVKIAMQEQKTGVDEFSITMNNLKELFIDTKDTINNHLNSLSNLIDIIEQTGKTVKSNTAIFDELKGVLDNFQLKDENSGEEEVTSIKLVD